MDSAGLSWTLITIVGPIVLLLVIAWAVLRNRGTSNAADGDCDEATRRVYDEEDREHRHESDNVP
jgi:hypothetical protein